MFAVDVLGAWMRSPFEFEDQPDVARGWRVGVTGESLYDIVVNKRPFVYIAKQNIRGSSSNSSVIFASSSSGLGPKPSCETVDAPD